jgi:hypothetical protein
MELNRIIRYKVVQPGVNRTMGTNRHYSYVNNFFKAILRDITIISELKKSRDNHMTMSFPLQAMLICPKN